jgi:hypothetical protein
MDELIEVNRMDKTLLYTIMLSNGECLRALGINILDSWNFSANLLGYFRSPRGLQGAALELLGEKISKDREEGKGCGWR